MGSRMDRLGGTRYKAAGHRTVPHRGQELRITQLQFSLLLMLVSATAVGCAAPGGLQIPRSADHRPSIKQRGTSGAAASSGWSQQQETPQDPSSPFATEVVFAAHVVPTIELSSPASQEQIPAPLAEAQSAADPQPVEYFVASALQSHPRIAAARLRVAAASARIPQARALPDPMINNILWPIPDNAAQTAGGRMTYELMLSQDVPWPEKLDARAAIAHREFEVARAEVDRVEREITEAVHLAYYELWYAVQAIAIVEDNRQLVSDLIAVAEARYRTGGAQQDVLRAELEADRLEDELIRLRRQREVAQADLGALLQRPVELVAEPVQQLDLPRDTGQLDQLIAAALGCNPELRGLAWQIAENRERQRLANLQRYPDLQFGLGWGAMTTNDALSPVADGRDNVNFTLGVTLPIWQEKNNARIREAAANTAATARLRDAEQDSLFGTLRRLVAEADGLFQQLDLFRTRVIPRTERTLQLAMADYRGERVDFFSLIDIYQELLLYQTQVARMEASLAGTLAQLDRAVGCPTQLAGAQE